MEVWKYDGTYIDRFCFVVLTILVSTPISSLIFDSNISLLRNSDIYQESCKRFNQYLVSFASLSEKIGRAHV